MTVTPGTHPRTTARRRPINLLHSIMDWRPYVYQDVGGSWTWECECLHARITHHTTPAAALHAAANPWNHSV